MRGIVGVLKWNAIPCHRVHAVFEAAEISLGLAIADAIRAPADSARHGLGEIGKVGYRSRKLAHVLAGDFCARRTGIKHGLDWRELRGKRAIRLRFHCDFLGYGSYAQGDRDARDSFWCDRHVMAHFGRKTSCRDLYAVSACRQSGCTVFAV